MVRTLQDDVMPGLDPGIHVHWLRRRMDCRVKPGNDDFCSQG